MKTDWQLSSPVQTVIFDCDGTLSTIEGIDELAKQNQVGSEVESLTAVAMGQTGLNPTLYQRRLELVQPTVTQVAALGELYFTQRVPDVDHVIQLFQRLGKTIYIVSAGLYPAVAAFGELLGVARQTIFAVDVTFDAKGNFVDFDHLSPLVLSDGKREIVQQVKRTRPPGIAYVGDGLNDYCAYESVDRFVGYGGIFRHEKLASRCHYYIESRSMAALLPLTLHPTELVVLSRTERELYDAGLALLETGKVAIR